MPTIRWGRSAVALPVVVGLVVLVASCGGSDGESADPSESSPSTASSGETDTVVRWPSATEANEALGHGVEVVSTCCGTQRNVDMAAQAEAITSKGFTGVRYAVWLEPEFVEGAVDQTDPDWLDTWLDQIRAEIDLLVAQDLTVVVNFNQNLNGDGTGDRIAARWSRVAEEFQDLPPNVYFEVLNEPNLSGGFSPENTVSADQWNAIVAKVIPEIRATNPQRIIVVPSAMWAIPQAIPELELPEGDEHLIATFHNYFPLEFTHQGSWDKAWIGTTWAGTPEEVATMKGTMNNAVCWSRQTGVPLFVGEFSSYDAGTYVDVDPMLWNKTMVQLMEAEDITWTYFLLTGLLDPGTQRISFDSLWDGFVDVWNQPVLDALEEGRRERIEPWADCEAYNASTTSMPAG